MVSQTWLILLKRTVDNGSNGGQGLGGECSQGEKLGKISVAKAEGRGEL